MKREKELLRNDLIYPELCYKVMGVLFEVFKQLGIGYQEKYYQRVIAIELENSKLKFKEQVPALINYKGVRVGRYYLDFLIEGKLILEIKKHDKFSKANIEQVFGYLKATKLKLGIIANFTKTGVKFKRIVNIK